MDELAELALTHLGGPVSEDEEQSVDGVGLARPVRPDDGGEGLQMREVVLSQLDSRQVKSSYLVERTDLLSSCVRLEIHEDHLMDHQSRRGAWSTVQH